ncbi:MAG: Uma2 family endonuclease [Planctomycetaceae bacterium]|nr:Uma2 family endonuclease [Planctomycetaceae bacterium]
MAPTQATSPTPLLSVAGFRKFTPAQYHKLIDHGVILEGEPIELLEGYLVEKSMRNPPHEMSLRRLTARFPRQMPAGWFLQIQGAIATGDSEPEPDGVVLRGNETTCDGRLPTGGDIAIVLEVSDSSLAFDRSDKGRIYARVGIPVYWIINIPERQIEVYTNPNSTAIPPAYTTRTDYGIADAVPIVLDGIIVGTIPVADLIP